MMHKPRAMSPIGIEIDQRHFSAVQLRRHNGGWAVSAAALLPRLNQEWPPSAAELQRLANVMARQGFVGRRLALAIPNRMLLTGVLDAPPISSGAPIEQIARVELARIHKRQADDLETCWWELPTRQRGASAAETRSASNVMAAACVVDDVTPLLDAFEQQQWDVEQLGASSWAMVNACANLIDGSAATALLDFNWSDCTVALLHRGVVVYQRTFEDAGLMRLHRTLMQASGCAAEAADVLLGQIGAGCGPEASESRESNGRRAAEANRLIAEHLGHIIQEVRASCSYLRHRFGDATATLLMVAGPGALVPGAAEILRRGLEMQVQLVDPRACLRSGEGNQAITDAASVAPLSNPSLVVALGLAMNSCDTPALGQGAEFTAGTQIRPSAGPRLNLVPRSRRLARHRRNRKRMWITVVTVYALTALAALVGSRVLRVFDSRAIAAQLELLEMQIDKAQDDAKSLRSQLNQVTDAWETANVVNSQPDWSLLLALLADGAGGEIVLQRCEIVRQGDEMGATGYTAPPLESGTTTKATGAAPAATPLTKWSLNLAGRARSQPAVSQFVLRLEQMTVFYEVRLIETRREPSADAIAGDQFVFLITCTMK